MMVRSMSASRSTVESIDSAELSKVREYLTAHESSGIPSEVQRTLLHVVDALQRGAAVSAAPQAGMLTTQQAADLLNVSRPTVVKLLDGKKIPFEMAGTHRRLRLADVMSFRDARRREQFEAIAALSSLGVDDEAELETTLTSLRVARKAVRRARSSSE